MTSSNFFEDTAGYWDDNYITYQVARKAAAFVATPNSGGVILDIGCGAGYMLTELLAAGANEVVGVDLSQKHLGIAAERFASDPRVSFLHADFMEMDESGFDAAVLFNGYTLFKDKQQLLAKVCNILIPGGRFTAAHSPGRCITNALHPEAVPEMSVDLLPAQLEAALWVPFFEVDVVCDTDELYMLSGVRRKDYKY